MIIGIPKETREGATRVAMVPFVCKKLVNQGLTVQIEKGAGLKADISDDDYKVVGAKLVDNAFKDADIIFKVWAPSAEEEKKINPDSFVLSHFEANTNPKPYHAFALEMMPRISRAQSMDILSSQSNLAGYQAVIEAVHKLNFAVPMMTTAAGTVPPAKFLIIGVGVAGLQAIATAKRLGGVVYATDIRPETQDQVISLGGKFINGEDIKKILPQINVVITTAAVLGKPAPILFTKEMEKLLPHGSLIVDMAGNVDKGVKVLKNLNFAAGVSHSASLLYANNLYNFFELIYNKETEALRIDKSDEIIAKTYIERKV